MKPKAKIKPKAEPKPITVADLADPLYTDGTVVSWIKEAGMRLLTPRSRSFPSLSIFCFTGKTRRVRCEAFVDGVLHLRSESINDTDVVWDLRPKSAVNCCILYITTDSEQGKITIKTFKA